MNKYLLIACLILLSYCIVSTNTCNKERSSRTAAEQNEKAENAQLKVWVDAYGQEHATAMAQAGQIEDLTVTMQNALDSASKRLQISKRSIEGYQKIVANVRGKITVRVDTVHDTLKFAYHDDYLTTDTWIAEDTAHQEYSVTVPIVLTEYVSRDKWYGGKTDKIDATTPNSHAHITQVQGVIIKEKPRGWRIAEAAAVGLAAGLIIGFVH